MATRARGPWPCADGAALRRRVVFRHLREERTRGPALGGLPPPPSPAGKSFNRGPRFDRPAAWYPTRTSSDEYLNANERRVPPGSALVLRSEATWAAGTAGRSRRVASPAAPRPCATSRTASGTPPTMPKRQPKHGASAASGEGANGSSPASTALRLDAVPSNRRLIGGPLADSRASKWYDLFVRASQPQSIALRQETPPSGFRDSPNWDDGALQPIGPAPTGRVAEFPRPLVRRPMSL